MDVVCVALLVKVTEDVYSDVTSSVCILCVQDTTIITLPPDRPNVYLDIVSHSCMSAK